MSIDFIKNRPAACYDTDRSALGIDFQISERRSVFLPYSCLTAVTLAGTQLTFTFHGASATLMGSGLTVLYRAAAQGQLVRVACSDRPATQQEEPHVTAIAYHDGSPEYPQPHNR
jgi:hypothetical protein